MNKTIKIILVILLVLGSGIAVFTDNQIADYCALSASFVAAALLCHETWNKSKKKDWKTKAAIILIAVASFGLGFIGVAGDNISKIIAAVGGVVLLIFGIIASFKTAAK